MYALVTLPTPTNLFTDITTWSGGTFTEFSMFIALIAGVLIGAMVVAKIISLVLKASKKVLGGGKRGRGRRR